MKLKFVFGLIQIASLRFIEALKGSKITVMQHAVSLTVTASTKSFCKQQLPFVLHHNNVQRVTCAAVTSQPLHKLGLKKR